MNYGNLNESVAVAEGYTLFEEVKNVSFEKKIHTFGLVDSNRSSVYMMVSKK